MFESLLAAAPFSLPQKEKEKALLAGMNELMRFHYDHCAPYAHVIDVAFGGLRSYEGLADIPYLPVSLFKELELVSTPSPTFVMHSSGTTGQVPSRIVMDNETASRQAEALIATFRPVLGERRMPFLVIDSNDVIKAKSLTARGAGVLGMMKFGARAAFALNSELDVDREAIMRFIERNGDAPFLIFGFTFLIWSKLYRSFADGEIDLSKAILVHSGGWKKLEAEKVSNAEFRTALARRFNLTSIHNFYGFVEQIGSIFLEGEDGLLYPPNFTDVIVRRTDTWEPADIGEEGVIEVLSLLPRSYPGHSVLTEDLGTIVSIDAPGMSRKGKALRVSGRVAKAELRGCSDVIAAEAR